MFLLLAFALLLSQSTDSAATVVWSDDFSDGDISDWTRMLNGNTWTVIDGELVQPDISLLGNRVLRYESIPWGDYVLEWDMRPIAKADALGPVCWAQSGPAASGFDWDCSLDVNGVPSEIALCGELGQTYHFRIETIAGVATVYIDGVFIGSGPYDPSYSMGFVQVETNSTSAVFDNFVLSSVATTATETSSWSSLKQLWR